MNKIAPNPIVNSIDQVFLFNLLVHFNPYLITFALFLTIIDLYHPVKNIFSINMTNLI